MKKNKKFALLTIATTAIIPTSCIIATCCSNGNNEGARGDDEGITVSTKEVEVNHNSGVGTFDVILDEQPIDNVAYVYIITAEGPHHVELLDDDESVYNGHPASLYDVNNGIAHVRIGFTEFIGESTKTVIGIEVRYNNRRGQWVLKRVNDINLKVTYVHNDNEEVHIFSLNDLHGVAEGYGEKKENFPATNTKDPGVIRIMNKISPVIESHPGSFLVTAGDNNAGDVFSTSMHGESIYKVLNSMGARYSAVGNHAFEWGISQMATYQFDNWARTDETIGNYFLASNILNGKLDDKKEWVSDPEKDGFEEDYAFWLSQKVGWADPYKIVNMNGHLVCLIGLTTKGTLEDGNKSVVDNLSFIDYSTAVNYSIYLCKQERSPQLFNSIESFILLTHVESDMNGTTVIGAAADLARDLEFEGVDAIISGHSHKTVNGKVENVAYGKQILVGQAEFEGRKVLDLTLRFDNTKPVGHRKIGVSQNIIDLTQTYSSDEQGYKEASDNIAYERSHPTTSVVENVIKTFDSQTRKMLSKLGEEVAKRYDSLLYPATKIGGGGIGHEYYINQRLADGLKPEDGGYIIDQLGAWVTYSMLSGFASLFHDQIEASATGLTYPAVALINQDSMKVQFDKPDSSGAAVTLKDIYALQTYENTTMYGYLSIWQLAKIIDHSLAGQGIFNYSHPTKNYYVPGYPSDPNATPYDSLNNLAYVDDGKIDDQGDPVYREVCNPKLFSHIDDYKGLKDCYCVYTCGPVQMYGIRFDVELAKADGSTDEAGRTWKLKWSENIDTETKTEYPRLPNIYILDPKRDPDDLYADIQEPTKWLTANEYIKKYKGMVPTITNDFLYNGANWETPMEAAYMQYNQGISSTNYPIIKFSQITRDLLIELCHLSNSSYAGTFPFDMPFNIVDQLVTYPNEP